MLYLVTVRITLVGYSYIQKKTKIPISFCVIANRFVFIRTGNQIFAAQGTPSPVFQVCVSCANYAIMQ